MTKSETKLDSNPTRQLILAATAAFCVYFCMHGFRKPFSAGTYDGLQVFDAQLKTVLIVSQIIGYMVSKFIGIKVVSEMRRNYRGLAIVGLLLFAEVALVGFAFVPMWLKPLMMFLNGLPLGMIFGLVLSYLEGRRHTEALSATLCASFIMSSGVVKSIGRWLVEEVGFTEFQMPMIAGLLFLPPLVVSVWLLQQTPPPDHRDRQLRNERKSMDATQRRQFVLAYWPGLGLLILVFIALTVIRTMRDDFGVEIWRELGVSEKPEVFATSETMVAICVTVLNGLAVCIVHNLSAIRATIALMCVGFATVALSTWLQMGGVISPFVFMVVCGVGMYVPYVAFHTTVFERLIAASRYPCNIGFLMYLADSLAYLGYVAILLVHTRLKSSQLESTVEFLPLFQNMLFVVAFGSIAGLVAALVYFHKKL